MGAVNERLAGRLRGKILLLHTISLSEVWNSLASFYHNLAYSDGASVGNPSRFGRAVSKIQFTEIST